MFYSAYLHENCVVHRNIRCHNVLINPNNLIKIRNIQLAPARYRSEKAVTMSSRRPWMSPEVSSLLLSLFLFLFLFLFSFSHSHFIFDCDLM